ncbi:dihydrofolate reductase family protein [uncultured Mailhella sp.]|uniref:dihydrofolate reductase family protein n=1 Tax=uncultured Mailhella sp. TaxID=1981031 RepID=UPI0025E83614|nr:dihydrofolate reductase family protein [uncultured Mailhella sp.]
MMDNTKLQDRPYVVCHMSVSLDGMVTGDFLRLPQCEAATKAYYRIHKEYGASAFACGRVTMEESFTSGWHPDLSRFAGIVIPPMDHVADENASFFAVSFDRHGSLGWKSSHIEDEDPGYNGAHVVEVLCESAPQPCLAYLHDRGVSCVFAGKDDLDMALALRKLREIFGIRRLLLEGGSVLNGAFLRADLVDELSLVVMPVTAADGDRSLFDSGVMRQFQLEDVQRLEGGVVWMRYRRIREK